MRVIPNSKNKYLKNKIGASYILLAITCITGFFMFLETPEHHDSWILQLGECITLLTWLEKHDRSKLRGPRGVQHGSGHVCLLLWLLENLSKKRANVSKHHAGPPLVPLRRPMGSTWNVMAHGPIFSAQNPGSRVARGSKKFWLTKVMVPTYWLHIGNSNFNPISLNNGFLRLWPLD